MWIVAIAWIYVVGLMAVTEPSIVAGIMTFFGYCVVPLSILFYLTGGRRRRARRVGNAGGGDTGDAGSTFVSSDTASTNSSSSADCDTSSSDSCSDSGAGDSGSSSD